MNIRRVTSLTALISFVLMMPTCLILYIVPQGRVAYWSDWRLWGLSKTQWGDLHINLGLLFLLAISLHIYYNWNPIVTYLKNRARQVVVLTGEFNIALVITLVVLLGTYFTVPPFSSILTLSSAIKDAAAVKYGEPPFGHAELAPLGSLIRKTGLDPGPSLEKLKTAGIRFDSPQEIFLEIARKNRITPKQLFAIMTEGKDGAGPVKMPELPPPGTGNKTLAQICDDHGLDLQALGNELRLKKFRIDQDKSLKTLAGENQVSPVAFYDLIRSLGRPVNTMSKTDIKE